ncbi:MAG TPA: hypothetical protein VIK28_10450 [Sedimentisphaerales bacterium]
MIDSTERIALRLLKALKKEWEREPSLVKCRTIGIVGGGVCKSQDEFESITKYLLANGLVKGVKRPDGFAVCPTPAGCDWIDKHTERWTFDRRLVLYGLIITFLLGVISLLVQVLLR